MNQTLNELGAHIQRVSNGKTHGSVPMHMYATSPRFKSALQAPSSSPKHNDTEVLPSTPNLRFTVHRTTRSPSPTKGASAASASAAAVAAAAAAIEGNVVRTTRSPSPIKEANERASTSRRREKASTGARERRRSFVEQRVSHSFENSFPISTNSIMSLLSLFLCISYTEGVSR